MPAGGGAAGQAAGAPTYSVGARGDEVRVLQELLIRWGFDPGTPDGVFGQKTADAMRAFQTFHQLPGEGTATPTTISYLQSEALWGAVKGGTHSPGLRPGVPLGLPTVDAAALGRVNPEAASLGTGSAATPPATAGFGGGLGGRGGGGPQVLGSTAPAAPTRAKPGEEDRWIKDNYAWASWTLTVPELAEKLRLGAREGWSPDRMRSEISETGWWKNTQQSVREWTEKKSTDPASAQATIDRNKEALRIASSQMGVVLSEEDLAGMAEDWARLGWVDPQVKSAIAGKANFQAGQPLLGDIGTFSSKAKQLGREYFVKLTDQEAFNYAKGWAGGALDEDNILSEMRFKAKTQLPYLGDHIDKGGTPRGFFAEQIRNITQLLEVDEENVDLVGDPRFNSVVYNQDTKGQPTFMNVADTRKLVKRTDDYWKTNNAAQEVDKLSQNLLQTFGR